MVSLLTTSGYTQEAIDWADGKRLQLLSGEELGSACKSGSCLKPAEDLLASLQLRGIYRSQPAQVAIRKWSRGPQQKASLRVAVFGDAVIIQISNHITLKLV